jgi:hypothetical protein
MVHRFAAKFGHTLRGIYGLAEATGPTHIVPRNRAAPGDPARRGLLVGIPVSALNARSLRNKVERSLP